MFRTKIATTFIGLFVFANASLGAQEVVRASSSQTGCTAEAVIDGDRFSLANVWKGEAGQSNWWWEVPFPKPRNIGAILQIQGDHDFVFEHAPERYVWQYTIDDVTWRDLPATRTERETRLFRLHRLPRSQKARALRLQILTAKGSFPAIREVEFYSSPKAKIPFPEWIIAVNTTHDPSLPNHGQEFIPLAKSCAGWESLQAQQIWLDAFEPGFCEIEPRPLCAFLLWKF